MFGGWGLRPKAMHLRGSDLERASRKSRMLKRVGTFLRTKGTCLDGSLRGGAGLGAGPTESVAPTSCLRSPRRDIWADQTQKGKTQPAP